MSDKPMIDIRNVSKWYGPVQVLQDCSVNINKGDVVVVCGPSGSGKSTLIKTVNALEPIQKGEIFVDGIKVNDPKTNLPKLRARVGMVFQHFELFPHLTVTENLTLAQIKVLARRVRGAIQDLDLSERQVLRDREVRKQLEVLEHHADPRAQLRQIGLRVADRNRVDRDLAFLERLERVDALDDRRLAAARRAAHDDDLALLYFGRAIGQDLEGAVPLAHVLDRNHGAFLSG